MLWLLLCLQRGLLQSARAYREVGLSILLEAFGRLAVGVAFVGLGLGVTGAYLGTLAAHRRDRGGARRGCCAAGSGRPRATPGRTRCS